MGFSSTFQERRRADSNRRIKVLQTSPLPLGYVAVDTGLFRDHHPKKKPRHLVGWGRRGHFLEEVYLSGTFGAITESPCPEGQSGKRDSNPRHQPWQGCALPTELFPHWQGKDNLTHNTSQQIYFRSSFVQCVVKNIHEGRLKVSTP